MLERGSSTSSLRLRSFTSTCRVAGSLDALPLPSHLSSPLMTSFGAVSACKHDFASCSLFLLSSLLFQCGTSRRDVCCRQCCRAHNDLGLVTRGRHCGALLNETKIAHRRVEVDVLPSTPRKQQQQRGSSARKQPSSSYRCARTHAPMFLPADCNLRLIPRRLLTTFRRGRHTWSIRRRGPRSLLRTCTSCTKMRSRSGASPHCTRCSHRTSP